MRSDHFFGLELVGPGRLMAAKRTSAGRSVATKGSGAGRKYTKFFLVTLLVLI